MKPSLIPNELIDLSADFEKELKDLLSKYFEKGLPSSDILQRLDMVHHELQHRLIEWAIQNHDRRLIR